MSAPHPDQRTAEPRRIHGTESTSDRLCMAADNALRTLMPPASGSTDAKARPASDAQLTDDEKRRSAALMRVNHVGEVCAQALYQAQAITARSPAIRSQFLHAAREEGAHLQWCAERIAALDGRPSLLNPLWYTGAFAIGVVAGRIAGDTGSLGFMAETERQVEQHLNGHLDRLPAADKASHAVVVRMRDEEVGHARNAENAGARPLPWPARWAMRGAAKVMTLISERI